MIKVSRRLKEVWEWKEKAYAKAGRLPLEQQIGKIIQNANKHSKIPSPQLRAQLKHSR